MSQQIEKEAVSKFGTTYTKYKETEWLFPCPNCKKLNKENLHVNTKNGVFHCFHCDYKGKLKSVPKLSDVINKTATNTQKNFDTSTYLMPFCRLELTPEQKQAIYKRGLTDEDIAYYNICGGKRIQIPNIVKGNFSDLICAWEWRKEQVTKYNPKYLYTEGVEKSKILFNVHNIPKNKGIILCEGIFNAITAGKNAVASYGCKLSNYQLSLLLKNEPKYIIIAYDSDLPGVTGATDVISKLCNANYQGKVYYILLPKGIDINDMGKKQFREYLKTNIVTIDVKNPLSKKLPKLLFDSKQ